MTVKNAAGEKREVVLHQFFPTNRRRIEKMLMFFADNTEKRESYYGHISKYVIRKYMAVDDDIAILTAERDEKRTRLHVLRKRQTVSQKSRWDNAAARAENRALEHECYLIGCRLSEITAELQGARLKKKRLSANIHDLAEVKPW